MLLDFTLLLYNCRMVWEHSIIQVFIWERQRFDERLVQIRSSALLKLCRPTKIICKDCIAVSDCCLMRFLINC